MTGGLPGSGRPADPAGLAAATSALLDTLGR